MTPPPRIGNPERERAMEALGDHYAAGRLDHDEYAERLDAAASARTSADLADLFDDLPRPLNPLLSAEGRRAVAPPPRRRARVWPLAAALLLLAAVTGSPWPLVAALLLVVVSQHLRHRTG